MQKRKYNSEPVTLECTKSIIAFNQIIYFTKEHIYINLAQYISDYSCIIDFK